MTIYIKPVKKASASGKVIIGDIAEVVAPKGMEKRIKALKIADITENRSYLVSVTDIIAKINAAFPDCDISNVGETDTVIEYDSPSKRESGAKVFFKTALVSVMLAAGSATAIMSFHSDAQMSRVFETYYRIFFGTRSVDPAVIHLPYSIGLAVGIIVFFNHFTGKKLTSDPTPIEVEMSTYESDVTDNIIDTLNAQRKKNEAD
ncbi:MAG: stage V sporulation protein AA [Firmicutes bacterium]|nr:stage V sporulation protein AA [Bacillota bacterium]